MNLVSVTKLTCPRPFYACRIRSNISAKSSLRVLCSRPCQPSNPLPQARSRAYSACRPSVGFLVAGAIFAAAVGATGVVAGAAAAGFSASPLHFATYAFSVILAASFAALLALHSSSQAFTVFFCASEGVEENARPEKITAEHTISTVRLFMSQLQFVPASFYVCFCANAAGRLQRFIESDIYGS